MPGFVGTFTSTLVTELHRGDQVQWYDQTATVRTVTVDDGEHVLLALSVPSGVRPIVRRVPKTYVLMARTPEPPGMPSYPGRVHYGSVDAGGTTCPIAPYFTVVTDDLARVTCPDCLERHPGDCLQAL